MTIKQGVNKNTIEQQNEKQADIEQMKKAKNTGQQYEKSTNKNRKKIIKKIKGSRSHVELSARASYPPSRPL